MKSSKLVAEAIGTRAGLWSRGMTLSSSGQGGPVWEKSGVWQVSWQVTEPQRSRQDGPEEEEGTLRDPGEESLCSLYVAHALPSIRDKWALTTSGHTRGTPSAQPQVTRRLLMRFSGGLLRIIKKQFLQTQY